MRASKVPLLSPKAIQNFSALEFIDYIKSLRSISTSKSLSKSVEGINISTGKRLIIRISRKDKIFTEAEIDSLSAEFKLDKQVLLEALFKRKIEVQDVTGLKLNPVKLTRTRKKADAKPKRTRRKRLENTEDQLVEPGSSPDLQEKSL